MNILIKYNKQFKLEIYSSTKIKTPKWDTNFCNSEFSEHTNGNFYKNLSVFATPISE